MPKQYRVVLFPEAEITIESCYQFLRKRSPRGARSWAKGIQDAVLSLNTNPLRCPLAPESYFLQSSIRQLIYGSGYRILFVIEGNEVQILYVRHPAQDLIHDDESTH